MADTASAITTGPGLHLDPSAIAAVATGRIRGLLQEAIAAIDRRSRPPASA